MATNDLGALGSFLAAIAIRSYSGKFVVRILPEAHRNLAIQAAESGVSLNRLVSNKLH